MADRIESFTVAVPAGTAQATPQETSLVFPPGVVEAVEIVIPSGHFGLTGIALAQAHQRIIPRDGTSFLVAEDEVIRWALDGYLNTGDWQAFAFNADIYAHSFYLRFLVRKIVLSTGRRALAETLSLP